MPAYPSGFYGISTLSTYNNNVTRRLAIKDRVAFGASTRFGGQQYEAKNVAAPYGGTLINAQGAIAQLVNELNLIAPILPEFGTPVILSQVGVATNVLATYGGIGVSYMGSQARANITGAGGGVSTSVIAGAGAITIDGTSLSTGLRVLYFGLTTSALNGVYTVGFGQTTTGVGPSFFFLTRSSDMQYWWHFAKPRAFVVHSGTVNRGSVFSLQSDSWEIGNTFSIASAASPTTVTGSTITMTATSYDPSAPSGINASLGLGAGNTSILSPNDFTPGGTNTGEYGFLANASMAKIVYIKNRARRLAYQIFKLRENYQPQVVSYQNNIPRQVGLGVSANNIGVSSANNLPPGSRYPSGFNRGF